MGKRNNYSFEKFQKENKRKKKKAEKLEKKRLKKLQADGTPETDPDATPADATDQEGVGQTGDT